MRTRAVAIPSDRSNAVGAVELECAASGLVVIHHGVSTWKEGYAPPALTVGTRVEVPWNAVSEVTLDGDRVFVSFDEKISPHHKLLLAAFSDGDSPDPHEVRRQRLIIRIATGVGMVVGGLLLAFTLARFSGDAGPSFAILLGCLGAAVILFVGLAADHRLGIGRVSDAARVAFLMDLAAHLPHLSVSARPTARSAPPAPIELPSFQALLPRSTTAVVITMSAALLSAVLTAGWLARTKDSGNGAVAERARAEEPTPQVAARAPAEPEHTAAAVAPAPAPTSAPAPAPAATDGPATLTGSCTCKRADSLLWKDGLPRLSTVLIDKHQKEHNGHLHLELEVGVVNNWDKPLPEVSLLVQFFEKDPPPSTKRTKTQDRPLFFEGPLAPGQAIMWHVEARGNDFEVTGPPEQMLDAFGADAPATNLVADLLKAIHRPIRLHGAMLLAYLNDPRAKDGAVGLREALREEEAPYIDRLMWTQGDVRTCAVAVSEAGNTRTVHACVYNTTKEPRTGLAMRMRALDRAFRYDTPVEAPPLVVAEHTWKLEGQLAPGSGATVTLAFDTSNPDGVQAKAFEAFADRAELVF